MRSNTPSVRRDADCHPPDAVAVGQCRRWQGWMDGTRVVSGPFYCLAVTCSFRTPHPTCFSCFPNPGLRSFIISGRGGARRGTEPSTKFIIDPVRRSRHSAARVGRTHYAHIAAKESSNRLVGETHSHPPPLDRQVVAAPRATSVRTPPELAPRAGRQRRPPGSPSPSPPRRGTATQPPQPTRAREHTVTILWPLLWA